MALDAINRITIDVSDPLNTPVVRAVQEDIRSRYVEIVLVRNGDPMEIPASAHGMIGIRRPNGTYVLYDETEDQTPAVTIDGNVVTAYLSQEALAIEGDLYTSVSIYTASQRLTAFHFIVSVEATAVPSGVVVESDYFNILEGVVSDAIDAADRAEQAAATFDSHASTHLQTGSDPIPLATTSSAGLVQLYNGVDSDSTTMAATAAAVKLAYENGGGSTLLMVEASSISSLPQTINDSNITADMVVVHSELSNPSAQSGDWTVTTAAGSVTISGTISGTTNIRLILSETI